MADKLADKLADRHATGEFVGPDVLATRSRLKLSQSELALCLGVHWNTLAQWERNERRAGNPQMLRLALEGLEARARGV